MSLGARGTKGGAKTAAKDKGQDKPKTDKPARQDKVKPQATTEQLRMAQMIHRKSDDSSDVRRMVQQLMETTCRTEEEVCSALHDADNDMEAACNLLLEDANRIQGEWQTSEKKKKKPIPPAPVPPPVPRRGRGARRGAPRRQRGRPMGRGAGGRGAGSGGTGGDTFPATEDWDNEEWSGSLSDTKVFTPSTSAQNTGADSENTTQVSAAEDWDAADTNGPTESHIPTYTYHNTQSHAVNNVVPAAAPPEPQDNYHAPHHQPMGMSGSLSAAQSQYLSQLTQQSQRQTAPNMANIPNIPNMPNIPNIQPTNSVYSSNYGVYGSADMSAQRKPQRARVPPPSKIPVSAVEMPGGEGGALFLDVQFGALDPDTLQDKQSLPPLSAPSPPPTSVQQETQEPISQQHTNVQHQYTNNMPQLNESLSSVVDTTPPSQPVSTESIVPNTTSLEKQLTASMKQLSVSSANVETTHHTQQQYTTHHHPRPKQLPATATAAAAATAAATAAAVAPTLPAAAVYPPQVSHHPAHMQHNIYATQVNSTNASLSASALTATAYPSSVALTQYQPMINNYQTSSSATVYGGNALYTAYQHSQPHKQHKEPVQYDNTVASSNSLTSTSTTQQTSTAKVATTSQSVSNVPAAGSTATGASATATAGSYAGVYGQYPAYDDQILRSQHTMPHHMTGYYEVGYGGREPGFGLAADRFPRGDAASPQQVPAAALPPGYAYFYQPPPTTYQYGVYPTYGGGSNVNVGGVGGGAAKLGTYAPQQPAYDQDNYKQAGPYTGNANKSAGNAAADLTTAMYAKTHVALNKVNSYDKAAFHSGTPPPFGAGSHLYLQQPQLHHHHQMDVRVNSNHNRRQESAAVPVRGAAKPAAAKPAYSQSYWAPN